MFAAINSFLTRALTNLTDVYWPFVSMLLHGDSPQQFNQDTSTNVFPISDSAVPIYSVASMQASTRTPFTGGPSSNGSGFFNGTNAGLSVPANAAFALGATSTIELWLYATSSATQRIINNYQGGLGFDILIISGLLYVAGATANATATFPLNAWTHLAVVYNSGTLTIYFNGVSQTLTGTTTGYNFTATGPVYIGNTVGTSQFFSGFMSNVRVVKGVAVYTGNFTPPTASLAATQSSGTNISAITGTQTSLLTLQTNVPQNNNQFFDTSTNNFTVTRNGNTTQGSFNPFVSTYPYAVATNGGSAYFDGTGDYLQIADNATLTPAGDFTIEFWAYPTVTSGTFGYYGKGFGIQIYATGNSAATNWWVALSSNNTSSYFLSTYNTVTTSVNAWAHIALYRSGNNYYLSVNGTAQLLATSASTPNTGTSVLQIGSLASTYFVNGYISNVRYVNGTAVYGASNFTPPTAPLTAVTNTALLLGMSNGAIYDNTMLNNLETVANAQISTSVFKYGTGALKFNGTTDYLNTSPANQNSFAFGSGDFTIEMWVNPTVLGAANKFLYDGRLSVDGAFPSIYVNASSLVLYLANGATQITGGAISTATWTHIAICRSGTSTKLFINGTQSGSTYTDSTVYLNNPLRPVIGSNGPIGAYWNGYIDDLRVTKGIARYTTTFTPPTAAFPNQGTTTYPVGWLTQRAIFGFGSTGSASSITNLVSNTGVVAANTTGVGTARYGVAAATYGWDKAIFGYGYSGAYQSLTNLVSNTGVMATDTTGVGTGRSACAAASYGGDKVIFGYGTNNTNLSVTNLVSNVGVVSADVTGVGTARYSLAAVGYGTDKAIYAYGYASGAVSVSNLVSSVGVVATDTTGVGTARYGSPAATGYGYTGQAIFAYGQTGAGAWISASNLVSSTGVIATDTTGVGTARAGLAAARYGGGTAIFAYGYVSGPVSMSNLVSATGVIASDTTGVGTARESLGAAGYSA